MAIALITLPRWLGGTLGRDRIWRLRDQFVQEILVDEMLPKDHPAVHHLLAEMDWVLRDGKHITVLHLALVERAFGKLDELKRQQIMASLSHRPLKGLEDAQCERMAFYRERFEILFTGAALLGSWSGLFQVARMLPSALMEASAESRPPRRVENIRRAPKEATDRAATETSKGRTITKRFRELKESWFAPRWVEHELAQRAQLTP